MRVALYFGSFNPAHNYHIAIANHLVEWREKYYESLPQDASENTITRKMQ